MKNIQCLILLSLSLFLAPAFCYGQESKFEDLDTDADGKVTKQEFKDYGKTKMQNLDLLDKFADQVDADKDGIISEEEFENRRRAFEAANKNMAKGAKKKKKLTKEQLEMIEEATKTFEATTKSVAENDWKKAVKSMTKKASEEYAISIVTHGLTLTQMQLPPQLDIGPVLDVKDATLEALEEYELDGIDITSFLNRRGKGSQDEVDGEDDMTPQEKAKARQAQKKARQDKLKVDVLAAIDKNDQRWEVVSALREAQQGSPVLRDVFKFKVDGADASEGKVYLTLSPKTKGARVGLPVIIKMTSEEGNWKYDGVDPPRTLRATQEVINRIRGKGAPAEPDTDF